MRFEGTPTDRAAAVRTLVVTAWALAMFILVAVPEETQAACAVFDDPQAEAVARHADTIVLARVAGPASTPDHMRLDVLRVYRGDPPPTMELADGAISCYVLSDQVGSRLLLALGDDPEYGPFTMAWFETPTVWEHFVDEYPSLGVLLRAIGVEPDLPDTSSAVNDGMEGGPSTSGALTAIWMVVTVVSALWFRSRREAEPRPDRPARL